MDRDAWWAAVHRVAKKSDTTEHACMQLQKKIQKERIPVTNT